MKISKFFVGLSATFLFAAGVLMAQAAVSCNFTRDLEVGSQGEDVRCLQKYLNGAGFTVAVSGPGAPGGETSIFREQTAKAVQKWQAANGLSNSGFFGPLSREKFKALIGAAAGAPTGDSAVAALQNRLTELTNQLNQAKAAAQTPTVTNGEAKNLILDALAKIDDAEEQIEEAEDDGQDVTDAEDGVQDARDDLFDAIRAYFNNDFAKASKYANNSIGNAEDAFEDAGGESQADKVEEYIDTLWDDLESAQATIDEADDDGKSVSESQDLLDQAEDLLNDAEDELDDENLDEAESLAEDAEDLIDESLDSIGDTNKANAKDAISQAKSSINDAQDEIDDAEEDDEEVSEANDLLDEARDYLDQAEDAYDDEDYDEAKTLAREARDKAGDAIDAIGD